MPASARAPAALCAALLLGSAGPAGAAEAACAAGQADICESEEAALLQLRKAKQTTTGKISGQATMSMWTTSSTAIVASSCEYARGDLGGLNAPSATSPYIPARDYCAASAEFYMLGAQCGNCYNVSYDGSPATDPGRPGWQIIQMVDSGSALQFDCQVTAFQTITGAVTGVFPVSFESVPCAQAGPPPTGGVITMIDGPNAWSTRLIISNLPRAVSAVTLRTGGTDFEMFRSGGATWSARLAGATEPATFRVTQDDGTEVEFDPCFPDWPVAVASFCTQFPVQVRSGDTIFLQATSRSSRRLSHFGSLVLGVRRATTRLQRWTLRKLAAPSEVRSSAHLGSEWEKLKSGDKVQIFSSCSDDIGAPERALCASAKRRASVGHPDKCGETVLTVHAVGAAAGAPIVHGSKISLEAPTGMLLADELSAGITFAKASTSASRQRRQQFLIEDLSILG